MTVEVRVPTVLAAETGGREVLEVDVVPDASLAQVLDALAVRYPGLDGRVRDPSGALLGRVSVYVGAGEVRSAQGLATPVALGESVTLVPAPTG